jgi:hypothetical protein
MPSRRHGGPDPEDLDDELLDEDRAGTCRFSGEGYWCTG